MIYDFRNLRPEPTYPIYPPYHTGKYLEDFIFEYYKNHREDFDKSGRTMIPVSWTTLYVQGTEHNIQDYLNVLPPDNAYWTCSQHDDGIRHGLPPNTLHFAAGGLGGGIPIPLICSPIPENLKTSSMGDFEKNIFCSFIGSQTHPIRKKLFDTYVNNPNFSFNPPKQWSQTVNAHECASFFQATQLSNFSLAPRGYGLSSFRLYEIMQLNSIPVYVSDRHWLPFTDELNWNEFCVIVKEEEIPNLENILKSISKERQDKMLARGKEVWNSHFSMESTCKQIAHRL